MTPADDLNPDETPAPTRHTTDAEAHPDPITGEAGAHPVGVGIGAVGAGVAGAVIGMVAGPVGAMIGAAIGAVAGGLAGKEVAAVDDEPLPADTEPAPLTRGTSDFNSASTPPANLSVSPRGNVAGSNLGDAGDIAAGQFHDAFTATTLHEATVENQIAGDDVPEYPSQPESVGGNDSPGGTPLAGMSEERVEHVRKAAYFRFVERQKLGQPGDETGDWLDAERRISPII